MRFLTSLVIGGNNKNKIDNSDDKPTQHIYQNQNQNQKNNENVCFSFTIGGNSKKKKSVYRRWSSPFHFSKRTSSSSVKSATSDNSFKALFDDFESQLQFAKEEVGFIIIIIKKSYTIICFIVKIIFLYILIHLPFYYYY